MTLFSTAQPPCMASRREFQQSWKLTEANVTPTACCGTGGFPPRRADRLRSAALGLIAAVTTRAGPGQAGQTPARPSAAPGTRPGQPTRAAASAPRQTVDPGHVPAENSECLIKLRSLGSPQTRLQRPRPSLDSGICHSGDPRAAASKVLLWLFSTRGPYPRRSTSADRNAA